MLRIEENCLDLNTYLSLRAAVGWKKLSEEQAIRALKNSIYTIVAYIDDKVVGMGRMVGDGAVICSSYQNCNKCKKSTNKGARSWFEVP